MRRACGRLDEIQDDWTAKAELALSKDREDLAKAALIERQKAAEMAEGLRAEMDQIEQVLRGYEADIAKLQAQAARGARPAECDRGAVRKRGHPRQGPRDHARQPHARTHSAKFELLERRADFAEGRAEALGISSLEDEIHELQAVASGRPRARSHEGRAQGARAIRKGKMEMARKIYPYSLDQQGREDRRRLLDARQRNAGSTRPSSASPGSRSRC